MKLTKTIIAETKKLQTPFLLIDLEKIRQNYRAIKRNIKGAEVFYAMKANDHPKILSVLRDEGCSFEIASLSELEALKKLNIPADKIMCFNSVKDEKFLKAMFTYGVQIMAFDSENEVDKIAKFAPSSKVVLRITVNNAGSDWPLTKKFGVDAAEALPLLKYAKSKNLTPIGLTFHVGSQCLNKNNWTSALYVCDEIWTEAKHEDIQLTFISLGGGIPVKHLKSIPSLKEIGEAIDKGLKRNFKSSSAPLRITIEPGRGMVGDAAIMGTTIVGKVKRGNEDWLWIDVGVFNGLMETIQGFAYEIKTEKNRKKALVTIAGPSCDSVDIPFTDIKLSASEIGERMYIMNAGAYTTSYAAPFNGFAIPSVYFINS
jgi:ornithine decarboxylase